HTQQFICTRRRHLRAILIISERIALERLERAPQEGILELPCLRTLVEVEIQVPIERIADRIRNNNVRLGFIREVDVPVFVESQQTDSTKSGNNDLVIAKHGIGRLILVEPSLTIDVLISIWSGRVATRHPMKCREHIEVA